MSWCGARKFTISVNETAENYLLAAQLLTEGCKSCITLGFSDDGLIWNSGIEGTGLYANITTRIYDSEFTG